ncbi:hypothetical protein [Arabiibacter massiliensis]|uniref:hypothetical protein n=1 Tax=Arabiibacter massiliensis TaxID=1870985 RepID=UPI00117A8E16|nr:hypothetical protein [Arabiibacter massiliensis]
MFFMVSIVFILTLVSCAKAGPDKASLEEDGDELLVLQDAAEISIMYPKNQYGETYGSLSAIPNNVTGSLNDYMSICPDLIAAITDEGVYGYVKKVDWFSKKSPDSRKTRHEKEVLTVYEVDGRTVAGELHLDQGE